MTTSNLSDNEVSKEMLNEVDFGVNIEVVNKLFGATSRIPNRIDVVGTGPPRPEGTVKVPEDRTQGRTPDRGRGIETLGELLICKRCRGPLRWYLEDEIAAARDVMMKRKQEIYKAEMEKNIKVAKQKENRRRQRRKKKLSKFHENTFKGDIFI